MEADFLFLLQLAAIGTGNYIFCPVMVNYPGRQVQYLAAKRINAGSARLIRKVNHSIGGIGHIQRVAN